MPPSCALLGGFTIGARVALLWQHNANAKCQRVHACTRSMHSLVFYSLNQFDNIRCDSSACNTTTDYRSSSMHRYICRLCSCFRCCNFFATRRGLSLASFTFEKLNRINRLTITYMTFVTLTTHSHTFTSNTAWKLFNVSPLPVIHVAGRK